MSKQLSLIEQIEKGMYREETPEEHMRNQVDAFDKFCAVIDKLKALGVSEAQMPEMIAGHYNARIDRNLGVDGVIVAGDKVAIVKKVVSFDDPSDEDINTVEEGK